VHLSHAVGRIGRLVGAAGLLLALAGCQSATFEAPRQSIAPDTPGPAIATAAAVTRPPVAARTPLVVPTVPPLGPPPTLSPAQLAAGSASSAGRGAASHHVGRTPAAPHP
jgi:hypothetical protein